MSPPENTSPVGFPVVRAAVARRSISAGFFTVVPVAPDRSTYTPSPGEERRRFILSNVDRFLSLARSPFLRGRIVTEESVRLAKQAGAPRRRAMITGGAS